MIASRYFVFLGPDDPRVLNLLNTAIFLLNPLEKWQAHITVGGPFKDRREVGAWPMFGGKVSFIGVGNFFSEGQQTVYLRGDGFNIRTKWRKSDYGYVPHLTLYNGNDPILAETLYRRLSKGRWFFHFKQTIFYTVSSTSGQGRLDLISNVFGTGIEEVDELSGRDLSKLKVSEKVNAVERILEVVRSYSHEPDAYKRS
jgi:hypothetical protein